MPASLDASPFAGTAPYYDRFRAPYAQTAIDFIVERYSLCEGARALDWDAVQAPSLSHFPMPPPRFSPLMQTQT
jgi:hypothetical protein